MTDKATGQTYRGLGHFSDVDDAGDEYSYCPCPVSETISTAGMPAAVSCVASGPVQVTFRVAGHCACPRACALTANAGLVRASRCPSSPRSPFTAINPASTSATQVENRVCDHKLSVIFPTDLNPAYAAVDEAFGVMQRDRIRPRRPDGWRTRRR